MKDNQNTSKISESLSKNKRLELEAGKEIIRKFIGKKYWSLYLDIFLLFAISMAYSIVLFFTEQIVGELFFIFAIICCTIISINQYQDMKGDIETALSDLDLIFK